MKPGIFNPHAPKPSPAKQAKTPDDSDPFGPAPHLDLDGDSYIIRFEGRHSPDQAADDLIRLVYDVNTFAQEHLEKNGVWVGTENTPPKSGTMSLIRDNIQVFVSVIDPYEVEVFRRIGYVLHTLATKTVLKRHKVKIIKRG